VLPLRISHGWRAPGPRLIQTGAACGDFGRNRLRAIEAGDWRAYKQPARRKVLDGQETWLRERFERHRGNADVIRQELLGEKDIVVSLRALVADHDAVTRSVVFNHKLLAFAKHWNFRPRACAPYRARTKGKTENGVGYVKNNAIAGRQFESWATFEAHLDAWTGEVADVRICACGGSGAEANRWHSAVPHHARADPACRI
jgi:hypothetical protein